jgi:hypothetical protein
MFTPGHSFGIVALDGLTLDGSVPPELHLDPSRSAMRSFPVELDEAWRAHLGDVLADRLERASLTFVATEPDMGPGRAAAIREAEALFRVLQLVGFVRLESHPVWVGGRTGTEGPVPEAVGELRRPRVPPGSPTPALSWVELGFALRLREGLRAAEERSRHGLMHRSVAAFSSGTHRGQPEERVHEFVRALEALVAPVGKGGFRRAFRRRPELFFGTGHRQLLERLYRVKRSAGHARGVLRLYTGLGDRFARRVALWHDAVTAEILVRGVLQRLLLSPELWPHFRDEDSLGRFWSEDTTPQERVRLWGRPIPVEEARTAFRAEVLHPEDPDFL